MRTEYIETAANPIIKVLEDNNSLELIYSSDSTLFPKVFGQCEFERKGFTTVGTYESEDTLTQISYEISKTSKYDDRLECTATAPLDKWKNWESQFPKDFRLALISNSPNFQPNTDSPITLYQEFIFRENSMERHTTVSADILQQGEEIIRIYKTDGGLTRSYSNKSITAKTYPASLDL